jgi:hypothetical protein
MHINIDKIKKKLCTYKNQNNLQFGIERTFLFSQNVYIIMQLLYSYHACFFNQDTLQLAF